MVDDCPYLDFSVEDSGIGIQPEAYDRLFKPFSQADSSISRKFGGTGLGLAISKRLAEAMGGSLTVISTPGQGSTFTFRFPLEASDHPRAADTNPPQSAEQPSDNLSLTQSNINVLVVEDHPISSILVGKMLKLLGCRTVFAYNGREAIAKFATGEFSAILMDMSMPVMDGLTATTRIRNLEAVRGSSPVPIIAITGNVMPGDHQRCLAAGMTDFLSKPYKKDDLAEKLRLCLLAK
jgi:CheY-like chemotaxis protein